MQDQYGSAIEERLKRALSIETVGVLFFDLDGRMRDANPAFERMSGYSRDELKQSVHWSRLTAPEFLDVTARAANELATRGHTAPYEKQMVRKDGTRWWGLFAPKRIGGSGQTAECVEFILDITHTKHTEERLHEALEEQRRTEAALREADRRKDEFLAILAHELRNPLAPIRTAVGLMRTADLPESVRVRARDIIERQVAHMARLVDDLLDVSRLSRGKMQLQCERLNLDDVLDAAIETARPSIEAHGHELREQRAPERVVLNADHARLAQVFTNLLNNAAKYTPMNGTIGIEVDAGGGQVEVRVTDTGEGIAAERLESIFEIFEGAGKLRSPAAGLGIGLALARRLVELHGGTLTALSPGVGYGATFSVRLPAIAAASQAVSVPTAQLPVNGMARRVLVVDDNTDAAETSAMLLQACGFDVRMAFSGEQALTDVLDFKPEIVLLDLGMPGLDGFETCRRLRARVYEWPLFIIAVTGWGQDESRRKTKQAGFDAHLVKPVATEALLQLLVSV
jgi:PAS domain S-box-containing protein